MYVCMYVFMYLCVYVFMYLCMYGKASNHFFSDKASNSSKITLVEENNSISDEEEIANIMNNYFINVTKTLNLKKQLGVGRSGINEFDP